jgi:hypothetical protein
MSCSSNGRSYRKLYDTIPIPTPTLERVVNNGNTATQGAYFDGDLEATGNVIGDGSQLSNLPTPPIVTLDTACTNDNVATQGAYFDGDLEASGFIKGDGSLLTNLPIVTTVTLDTVCTNGNVATQGAYFDGDLEATGYVKGDGSQLINLPTPPIVTLDTACTNGNTATQGAYFDGDLEASGFVKGDGSQLTNLPIVTTVTLDTVCTNGNVATRGAYFDGDLEATGFVKGDGSQLINLPVAPTVTLASVCNNGNVATRGAYFDGDLEATGNVIGDGSQLSNLPTPPIVTLDTACTNGNVATRGAYFDGDLEASGFVKGNGSRLTNLPSPTITLDTVCTNGNVATRGAKFNGDLEATGNVIGDGSLLTNLPSPTITLDTVCTNGNTATRGAKFNGDLEATGYVKGNGSQLTNLPIPSLQAVTSVNSTTSTKVSFSNLITSLETSGNVIVSGDVTATKFYGSGSQLTSIVTQTELNSSSSRISTLESKPIITNTSGITTNFTKGDILYASGNSTLSKLAISTTAGRVLTVSSTGVPEWSAAPGVSSLNTRVSDLENDIMITSTSGITSLTKGDILYASGTNALTRLPKGNAGQYLAINSSGIPQWVNGTASTTFITESYPGSGQARVGIHNTAPQHSISFGTSYFEFIPGAGAQGQSLSNLVIQGNVFADRYYGDGSGITNIGGSGTSDIRIKSNVSIIVNSLDTISKLNPVIYEKNGIIESGFIAQDIYYDVPELKHAVIPGEGATPNETKNEPSYDDWGENVAQLDYYCIIPYAVGAIKELQEMIEQLEK